jgi:hypothetical protein
MEKMPQAYQYDVVRGVDCIFRTIADALVRGAEVVLKGWGTFSVYHKRAWLGGVPPCMEGMGPGLIRVNGKWRRVIAASRRIKFVPGKDLVAVTGIKPPHRDAGLRRPWAARWKDAGIQIKQGDDGEVVVVDTGARTSGPARTANPRPGRKKKLASAKVEVVPGKDRHRGQHLERSVMRVWEDEEP